MKNTIDQFMWGYQPYFRRSFERETEAALAQIGLPVEARVVLVGFALSPKARHQVCVEPEHRPLTADHLSAVLDRAEELKAADPLAGAIHTDPNVHERWEASRLRRFRAAALEEAIDGSGVFEELAFTASSSAPVGGYEVHTCVGVPTAELDELPAFDDPRLNDHIYVGRSLPHEVIAECLRRADAALHSPDPGSSTWRVLDATEEMVQAAAVRLADGIVLRMGGRPADLFHKVNAFTSLGYERAAAGGRLVVAHRQNGADLAAVRFREPVPLSNSRIMRKLLELSDESTPVITDGQCAYGLGTRDSAPDIVGISVRGHAEWELSVNGDVFMRVAYGHAKLPRPLLARDKFDEAAQRTLGSADMDRIWATIEEVRNSEHGTMLVVSNRPEEETNRLGGQALPIRPQRLDPPDVARLGSVDGAVLLGPDGRCHAFGVILDGKAAGHGDPARGSRYNSAVRYQKMKPDTLLVVISDDGTIDLVPDLKPQVHRDAVEAAVQAFCETCETDPVNSEQFSRTYNQVKKLAFYLGRVHVSECVVDEGEGDEC